MVRRYYRRRTYRRKRTISKRKRILRRVRRIYGKPKPDGTICAKIHGEFDIGHKISNGWGAILLNWAGNGLVVGTNTARLTT